MSNLNTSIDKASEILTNITNSINGISKTDGISPLGLSNEKKREIPGFTPNDIYDTIFSNNGNSDWYGNLLDPHPDSLNSYYMNKLSTSDRFDQSKLYPNFKDNLPDPYQYYSTRDYYTLFNDKSTDYFKYGLQVIDNKTPLRSDKNTRETWDGSEIGTPLRLSIFDNTPYENTDPIYFGFELIIDAISSPLLNGSVEDFINQFSSISEVGSRKYVLADFKHQFVKLFKTKGSVFIDQDSDGQTKTSIPNSTYPNADMSNSTIYEGGRKAYMSYYLKKIAGLELLVESNLPAKKKYLVDYRNDMIKFTFNEDVSSSMGTLSHLYKLLYWSKTNGKSLIPDNLLRFNCDIIISEMRNLNRVRKALDTGNLEVIKENVSRHVYSLKECQFWFDLPAHDTEIDISQPPKEFDQFVVTMDYKYVTSKFERWVPDDYRFGKYVGYNNGAIWKIGNPGARTADGSNVNAGTINDNSVPAFFTVGDNYLRQNGVQAPIVLENYSYSSGETDTIDDSTNRTNGVVSVLEQFKKNSIKSAIKVASDLAKTEIRELRSKVNIRTKLLNDTLDKIRNFNNKSSGSSNNFFDVRNSLSNFTGDSIGNLL